MPIHDWTRVDAGVFHSFHTSWIAELTKVLNAGLLPPDYYALGEQIAGSIVPDVLSLQVPRMEGNGTGGNMQGATAVAESPPKVRMILRTEMDEYALKQKTVVIRHSSQHRIIALIEILSQGNKASRHAFRAFLDKSISALRLGIHLLLIDLPPPSPRDLQGIHGAIWEQLASNLQVQPADKPLTLVAYSAAPVITAYVEPLAMGDLLPAMPLFLDPEFYINVPLEATYRSAYEGIPRYYRQILEQ